MGNGVIKPNGKVVGLKQIDKHREWLAKSHRILKFMCNYICCMYNTQKDRKRESKAWQE